MMEKTVTLDKKEGKTSSDIESKQFQSLKSLLEKILPDNLFYNQKLAGSDLNQSNLEDLLNNIPLTSKGELVENQQKFPPYGTNLTYPLEKYVHYHQTSASSGRPMRWLDTADDWSWIIENWDRVYRNAGIRKVDRIFFAFSFGPFLGFWSAFYAAQSCGFLSIPGGGMSTVTRLHMIFENEATVLCCTPTYAIRLGEVAALENFDLEQSKIKTIIVAGEPGGSIKATRNKINKLWPGSSVVDHHGMTEVGPVSYQCPFNEGILRVIESSYIAEVIDPVSLKKVEIGNIGELVLTTLGRSGSPLLRYRTGDLVKRVYIPVPDKEIDDFALEGGILGRADDSVSVKGVNVYPGAFEKILRKFDEIVEYRVCLTTKDQQTDIELQIEPGVKQKNIDILVDQIQKQLNAALSLRIPVSIMKPGELPRFEMKAKRWVHEKK
jgi:phenylacetate-CoA ligase